jgi:chorismate mutase
MAVRGIRGATTVDADTGTAILSATAELLSELRRANGFQPEDIAGIWFTMTSDLRAEFPAKAARQMGWNTAPMLCGHEMQVPGALSHCIRVLILVNTDRPASQMQFVYLREAAQLRKT